MWKSGVEILGSYIENKNKSRLGEKIHLYLKNKMQKQLKASFKSAQVKPRFSIARS